MSSLVPPAPSPLFSPPKLEFVKQRPPSELPVAIESRWFKTYTRKPFDDVDDYVHVITWADGSTEERRNIPREWHPISKATHQRKIDEAMRKA